MKLGKILRGSAVMAVTCSMIAPAPVKAEDGKNTRTAAAAIAAAALIGIAASSHHDGHYPEGRRYDRHEEKAEFERGYRDGVHYAPYNDYNKSQAYRDGWKAGLHERDQRISHNQSNQWEEGRHAADSRMQHKAAREGDRYWNLPRGSAIPVRSSYNEKNGNYRVVVAAGYRKGVCVFDRNGEVIRFSDKTD